MVGHDSGAVRPVLAIGEVLIDFIVDDSATSLDAAQSFVARSGGAPANVAVALSRLGVPSAICGVVGEDAFGVRLAADLASEGVDTTRLRQSDVAATTFAFAWKDDGGDGHFWLLRGADAQLGVGDVSSAGIDRLGALVVGSVSLAESGPRAAIQLAVSMAAQHNVPVVFDVNWRPTVWSDHSLARDLCEAVARSSQLVKLSMDDARGLFGGSLEPEGVIVHFLALGPGSVVLTDGARGCWFASQDGRAEHFPSYRVEAVEPTGAGDAFLAALVSNAISNDWAPLVLGDIRGAAAAGALATTRRGAWGGLPSASELEAFLLSAS